MDHAQGRFRRAKGQAAIVTLTRFVLVLSVAAAFSAGAEAQDEHQRRLAAELVVMAGDVRRLEANVEAPQHLKGLRARLAGSLSSLSLLIRRAGGDSASVSNLRAALARSDWRSLRTRLTALQREYPLYLGAILPASPTPERLRLGETIHRQTCAGCHDVPAVDTELPAFNLFEQIGTMPREEFAARLIIGVRGNKSTAYRNPFSDLEIGALMAYYESAPATKVNSRPDR